MQKAKITVAENGNGMFGAKIETGTFTFEADAPASMGGKGAPSPYDLILASLGACTTMTIRGHAFQQKIPLEKVKMEMDFQQIDASEWAECPEGVTGPVNVINRKLTLEGAELTDEQRKELIEVADTCPVHQAVHGTIHSPLTVVE